MTCFFLREIVRVRGTDVGVFVKESMEITVKGSSPTEIDPCKINHSNEILYWNKLLLEHKTTKPKYREKVIK